MGHEVVSMKKNIIFDMDGVLCFTDHYHYLAWKQLADRLGVYFDETINNRLRGVSRMASLDIILERSDQVYADEEKQAFAEEKNAAYRELLHQMTPDDVSNEVRETLTELRKRGYRLAIGSSSKNAPLIMERTDLTGYFDAVSDGNNITRSKPDPEVFLKAAEFLGVAPDDCFVVEDAKAGIEAGNAAGMATIAIGDAVSCGLAAYSVSSFREIMDIVDKANEEK